MENGTGTLTFSISYTKEEIPALETKNVWFVSNEIGADYLGHVYVEKLDFDIQGLLGYDFKEPTGRGREPATFCWKVCGKRERSKVISRYHFI